MQNQDHDLIQIEEELPDHHFRTEIPNIVFELGLNSYEFVVYCYIKRVAGQQGICWQSMNQIANGCKISIREVRKSINRLAMTNNIINLPLIRKTIRKLPDGSNDTNLITVVNIWPQNGKFFNNKKSSEEMKIPESHIDEGGEAQCAGGEAQCADKEDIYIYNLSIQKGNAMHACADAHTHTRVGACESNQKKALQEALPFSKEKDKALKASPNPNRLTERPKEQIELIKQIKELNLNSDDATIGYFVNKYDSKRIEDIIYHFKNRESQGWKPRNRGGAFRNLLENEHNPITELCIKNKDRSEKIKNNFKWYSLVINDKYVRDENLPDYDLSLNMTENEFFDKLKKMYERRFECRAA